MPASVADKILSWAPAKRNALTDEQVAPVRPLLMRLVLASEPETPQKAARLCLHVAGFLVWVGAQHPGGAVALRAHHLWDERLRHDYHRYLVNPDGAGRPAGSADTTRSEIGWVLHRARPGARRHPSAPRPVAAPYTAAEAQRLVRQARNQPTAALQRTLSFVVALGLGAGLDGQDQRYVRRSHIVERVLADGQVVLVVRVVHPERVREVVVLARYEPLLRHALELHRRARLGKDRLVLGEKPDRKNITGPVKARAQTGDGTPIDLDIGRMRSTGWPR